MKVLQKITKVVLGVLVISAVGGSASYAGSQLAAVVSGSLPPNVVRYRVIQGGTHVTPLQSHATEFQRVFPFPPKSDFDSKAGEVDGYVQFRGDAADITDRIRCYSLYKGFWHYATTVGRSEFIDSSLAYPHYVAQSDVTPIPEDSVVTVVNSNGQAQSHVPVRVVDPSLRDGYPVSLDVDSFWLPRTDSDFKASYQAMFNEHGYTTKNLLETNSLGKFGFAVPSGFPYQAIFAAKYKGFWHYSPNNITLFPASQTLTMPVESSLTLNYLGQHPANIQVMVADPIDNTKLLTADRYTTSTNGTVTYAIPAGTQFRFFYFDNIGDPIWTQVVTAPVSGSVIVKSANNPALLAPANNASASTGQVISFDWGDTLSATRYLWFYRYNDGEWYYMDRGAYTGLNLSGLPNAGKWDWKVLALNSAGSVIAESEERTINVIPAVKSVSIKHSVATKSVIKKVGEVIDFKNKAEELNLTSKLIIVGETKSVVK